jgi:hypothetical protein
MCQPLPCGSPAILAVWLRVQAVRWRRVITIPVNMGDRAHHDRCPRYDNDVDM